MANETEQERLQRLLEGRIKRHGTLFSYKRGCRCERCKRALAELNKNQFAEHQEKIKVTRLTRQKYQRRCAEWLEEYFPEVCEAIKKEIDEVCNGAQ